MFAVAHARSGRLSVWRSGPVCIIDKGASNVVPPLATRRYAASAGTVPLGSYRVSVFADIFRA